MLQTPLVIQPNPFTRLVDINVLGCTGPVVDINTTYEQASPRHQFLLNHPTPVTSNRERALHWLQLRRRFTGLTQRQASGLIGISSDVFNYLETGTTQNHTHPYIVGSMALFGIRYSGLPFTGLPIEDNQTILSELLLRCHLLGLAPYCEDFIRYTGISFVEIEKNILSDHPITHATYKILTSKFHMRVWPPPANKVITNKNFSDLKTHVKQLMRDWHINPAEFSQYASFSEGGLRKFLSRHNNIGNVSLYFIVKLGYTYSKDHQLPVPIILNRDPKQYYLGPKLCSAIQRQMAILDWNNHILALSVRTQPYRIRELFDWLNTIPKSDETIRTDRYMFLDEICTLLKIDIHTKETIPIHYQKGTTTWNEERALLLNKVEERRIGLRYSLARVVQESHGAISWETLKDIVSGNWNPHYYHVFESYLDLFRIVFDPFRRLSPLFIDKPTISKTLKPYYQHIRETTPISFSKLAKQARVHPQQVSYFFNGRLATTREESKRLCRILKIHLPLSSDPEEAKKDNLLRHFDHLCEQQGVSYVSIMNDLELSEDDFYRFKRGDFTLESDPVVQRIFDWLNVRKVTWTTSKIDLVNKIEQWIQLAPVTKADIAHDLGLSYDELCHILNGNFIWDDEIILHLAIKANIYSRTLIQCALEDYHGDRELFAEQTGLPHIVFDNNFYTAYSQPSFTTTTLTSSFTREDIFYRYSIGDVALATQYCASQKLETRIFYRDYIIWVHDTYGQSFVHNRFRRPGKVYSVRAGNPNELKSR